MTEGRSDQEQQHLESYRREVRVQPRPTDAQIDDFVDFVAEAHSWYKHLPLFPPGQPFTFFLNPTAGMEVYSDASGTEHLRERTDQTLRFHYTWMTTAAYRERFGLLDYSTEAGTGFLMLSEGNVVAPCKSTVGPIPRPICDAGRLNLTGVVHKLSSRLLVLERWANFDKASWPEETGGEATLQRIKHIADYINDDTRARMVAGDAAFRDSDLEELFAPERARLRTSMRESIVRVLDLVFAQG